MIKKVRGRIPALVKIFKSKLKDTIIISLTGGGKITVNTDGSTNRSAFTFTTSAE